MGVVGGLLALIALILTAAYIAQPFFAPQSTEDGRRSQRRTVSILRERATLLAERNAIYRQIRDLDFEHATHKVADQDYTMQRHRLAARGVETLQQLDSLPTLDESPEHDPLEAAILALRKPGSDTAAVGAATCPQCGMPVVAGDRFCGHCGVELTAVAKPALSRCPSCGTNVEPTDRFCGRCGAHLEGQR